MTGPEKETLGKKSLFYFDLYPLPVTAVLSLIGAPVLGQSVALGLLAFSVLLCAATVVITHMAIHKSKNTKYSDPMRKALLSPETNNAMWHLGSACLTCLLALGWLGCAGLLWVFDSFFVCLAAWQTLGSVALFFRDIDILRRQSNATNN